MLKRSLRPRSLNDKHVSDYEVTQCIEGLLAGKPCEEVPARLAKSVISNLTKMRKDCILQRHDQLANKIDEILGELRYGPEKYSFDIAENPNAVRERSIKLIENPKRKNLNESGTILVNGARVNTVDTPTRLALTPVLKTRRSLEVSRMNYSQSKSIDTTLDNCAEYEIDSKRVGPRLLKVQELRQRLSEAQQLYAEAREKAKIRRQNFSEIRKGAEVDLENKLKDDMLVFGSHLPTTLPLEYSKFSNKVLDMRVREHRSAQIKNYDDARALRNEAVKMERQELDNLSQRFQRSFTLQRQQMVKSQQMQRQSFDVLWKRKQDKYEADLVAELTRLRKLTHNLAKQVEEAEKQANGEISRIQNNDRRKYSMTPLASRPKSLPTLQ